VPGGIEAPRVGPECEEVGALDPLSFVALLEALALGI
jgi:hypothetical protein